MHVPMYLTRLPLRTQRMLPGSPGTVRFPWNRGTYAAYFWQPRLCCALIPYLTQEGLTDYSQRLGIYNKSDRDEHLLLMKRAKGTLIIVRIRD